VDDLTQLADLIKKRNLLEREITALVGRPAEIGHIGEYIASRVFHIALEESASHKSIDGRFRDGPLKERTVNIKWYARREGLLDITPDALPDYYLVLTGPKSGAVTSRGQVRPWTIENVFLFDAQTLVDELKHGGVKIGVATSVRQHLWAKAEIYPAQRNDLLELSEEQREALMLFTSRAGG
jgi:hypothetical protein